MKTYKDPWPKRTRLIQEQPKVPEGTTVTTVYTPEPKFPRRKEFRREAQLCEHIDTKDYYKRKLVRRISPGAKPVLTEENVIEARLLAKEMSLVALSEKYGVGLTTIKNAVKGITFKHLNLNHRPQS